MTDIRLIQGARMLALERDGLAEEGLREQIASHPDTFADVLFEEAAASDDVISIEAALDYLEGRLSFFGDLLEPATAIAVRDRFEARLEAWK